MKKVLVTGGRGFLGSAIVAELTTPPGASVISVDVRAPPRDAIDTPRVRHVLLDACRAGELARLAREVDVVINAAGLSDNYHPEHAVWRTNHDGADTAVRATISSGDHYLLHISSSSVYGPSAGRSSAVEDQPLAPVGCYASSKAEGERLVTRAIEDDQIQGLVVRPFTVVGPGQRLPTAGAPPVLVGLIRAALTGRRFVVHGSGEHLRDYVGVADVARAIAHAVTHRITDVRPVNLGSGSFTSILELAGLVERATGRPIDLHVDARGQGGDAFAADVARMTDVLTSELEPLETVVESTVRWLRTTLD